MVTVAFIPAIVGEQAVGQAVGRSMLDNTGTAPSMIGTGGFRTDTLFHIWAIHISPPFFDGNQPFVPFAIFTRNSITGTSVKTPTVVARAAGDDVPNRAIATATANSKKLDAPIIPAGAAMLCGSFKTLQAV